MLLNDPAHIIEEFESPQVHAREGPSEACSEGPFIGKTVIELDRSVHFIAHTTTDNFALALSGEAGATVRYSYLREQFMPRVAERTLHSK
jgi:hypothetical protein